MKKFMKREILPKPTKRARALYNPVLKYFDKRWRTIRCIPSIKLGDISKLFGQLVVLWDPSVDGKFLIIFEIILLLPKCFETKTTNFFSATQELFL